MVPVYANQSAKPRCLVFLLDLYFSKLPVEAFEKEIFYMKPKLGTPPPGRPWFDPVPVGKEKLRTMVKDMFLAAGITERKTNHSLRATGATQLFASNVPEKMIQSRTGHRSLDALRLYERPTDEQNQAV